MELVPPNLDHTVRLPAELIYRILDGYSFEELLPVMAVCARWRLIALNQDAYWSPIVLKSCSAASACLFMSRIARSGTRPVTIRLIVESEDSPCSGALAIFTTLRDHLHHVAFLDIVMSIALVQQILIYMTSIAPSLESFHLCALWSQRMTPLPVIPTDLFAYNAPALRAIELENVILPEEIPVLAFLNVTNVCVCFGPWWEVPIPDVFVHFPSMTQLRFTDPVLIPHKSYLEPVSWMNVLEFSFHSERMRHGLNFPIAAVANVPYVRVTQPTAEEMSTLIQQLSPPYSLEFPRLPCEDSNQLFFVFAEADRDRERCICDMWTAWHDESLGMRSTFRERICQHITNLKVSALCWGSLASILPPMENLRSLALCITDEDDLSVLGNAGIVTCPALEQITMCSLDGVLSLTADEVATFIRAAIAEPPMHLSALNLDNVDLTGSNEYLRTRFMTKKCGIASV